MWTFEYLVPAGQRCHKEGYAITTYGENCWFHETEKRWTNLAIGPCSTHAYCKTLRGFKRHLRKHPELRGQEVVLVSRYEGLDIIAKWTPDRGVL